MFVPKITFSISSEKDIETFFAFANETYDLKQILTWAFWNPYPELKLWFNKNKLIVDRETVELFVKSEYTKNNLAIKDSMRLIEITWREKEEAFSKLIEQLFPNTTWPEGKYECLATIWGMYPRFLEDKTFQVPWKHERPGYALAVIPHEMLHFIWYSEFYKNHPEFKSGEDDYFIWHVSELFNSIILGLPSWLAVFEQEPLAYPQHEAILSELKPKYASLQQWTAEDLTKELIERVKNAGLAG